ncbi:ankyrin repeat-containing protein [Stemphylium lycopersici]|uniref:Ankyrin repeat-containing protein n=1 Tax=Stemphylium lycopersici TaxID=183478 RepID=A0A364N782_STELY|nr:ankyrin repeat-containing protein [Stemphylium lycopersici]
METTNDRHEDAKHTGGWLYSNTPLTEFAQRFCEFRDDFDSGNQTLACPGYPGVGKTCRAVSVKNHLASLRNSFPKPHETAISALYLGHGDVKILSSQELILYLFEDLERQCQGSGLRHDSVAVLHRTIGENIAPSDEVVFTAFDSLCQSLRAFYIIVDGLEEYPYGHRKKLLDFISRLQAKRSPKIKMYVTFRPMGDFATRFQNCKSSMVLAHDDDIRQFIDNKINTSEKLLEYESADPKLRETIKSTVLKVSEKMFFIAWAHMQRLADVPTLGHLEQTLSDLSSMTANDFYRDELINIHKSGGYNGWNRRKTGLKILSLVYFSRQRLSLKALQYAIALEIDAKTLPRDKDYLSPTDIKRYTRLLVSVHEETGYVSSSHQTARTYFDRVQWCDFPEAAQDIISVCAKHLSFLGTEVFPTIAEFAQHAFTSFALAVLGDQIRLIEGQPKVTFHADQVTLLVPLGLELRNISSIYHESHQPARADQTSRGLESCVMSPDLRQLLVATAMNPLVRELFFSESEHAKRLYNTAPTNSGPLAFGALLGSQFIVSALLTSNALIDHANSEGDTALTIAMKLGCAEVVDTLLQHGATFDCKSPAGWEVLLHTMTQPTGTDRNYACIAENALNDAVAEAKKKQFSKKAKGVLLLKSAYDGHYEHFANALSICTRIGVHPDLFITAFLVAVERKRLVSGDSSLLGGASQDISRHGSEHDKIIERLLEHGVDVNRCDGAGNTALHRAARWNSIHLVQYLLAHGASPDIKNKAGHTPWHTICDKPTHQDIGNLLLGGGGDPNTRDHDGVSCLYIAAAGGHIESMMTMLTAGTDPGIQTLYGWTPLHWAAGNGHYEATRLLLDWDKHPTRADPNCLSDTTETALDRAIASGHMEIIELLRLHGGKTGRELLEIPSASSDPEVDAFGFSLDNQVSDEELLEFWRQMEQMGFSDASFSRVAAGTEERRSLWKRMKKFLSLSKRNRRSASSSPRTQPSTPADRSTYRGGYTSSSLSPQSLGSRWSESRSPSVPSRGRSGPASPRPVGHSLTPLSQSGSNRDDGDGLPVRPDVIGSLQMGEVLSSDDRQNWLDPGPSANDENPRQVMLSQERLDNLFYILDGLSQYERELAARHLQYVGDGPAFPPLPAARASECHSTCLPKGRVWPEICTRCVKGKRDCDPGRNAPRVGGQQFTVACSEETKSEVSNQVMELLLPTSDNYEPATSGSYPSDEYQLTADHNGGIYPEQGDALVYHVAHYLGEYNTWSADWPHPYQVENLEFGGLPETTYGGVDDAQLSQSLESRVICVASETQFSHATSRVTELNFHLMPGPTYMASHNYQIHMIWRLENRVARLWGCYETFACTGAVSELFSQIVSCFFGTRCREYAAKYPMVHEAYLACGAADALMNWKLPPDQRNAYRREYDKHHARAQRLINEALDEFRRAGDQGRYRDVLPVYYAAFLFHAAAACAQEEHALRYLNLAEQAFSLLDAHTTEFPLGMQRYKQRGLLKGNWGVRMLVSNCLTVLC